MNKLLQQMQKVMDDYLESVVYVDAPVEKQDVPPPSPGKPTPGKSWLEGIPDTLGDSV